jgi:tetratricopeptide (TPR) repeat protein
MTQPATRTTELLNQINGLSSRDRDNDFLLKSLERQARQVIAAGDLSGGYTLLGALAAVREDAEETRSYHDRAASAAPTDPSIFRNYAISLLRLGLIDDAIAMADRSWKLDKTDRDNFFLLIQLTCQSGRIQEAAKRLHAADMTRQNHSGVAEIEDAASLLARRGISDKMAGSIARAAMQIVAPISVAGVANRVAADDESKWVDFAFAVNDSVEKVMELNLTLADRIAELSLDSEIGRASSTFVVRFTRNAGLDASSSR